VGVASSPARGRCDAPPPHKMGGKVGNIYIKGSETINESNNEFNLGIEHLNHVDETIFNMFSKNIFYFIVTAILILFWASALRV
jgi:hypothetical protein